MEFADYAMLAGAAFCFIFFTVRSFMALPYIQRGIKAEAKITNCEKVMLRKSTRVDKEDITANKYIYEYKTEEETAHSGEISGLYSDDKFSIGDAIDIRYLQKSPEKSRYYPFKDFLQFEVPFLVIGVAMFATVIVRVFVWQIWQ